MKHSMLAAVALSAVAGCTPAQLAMPVPTAAVTNAGTALAAYQAALGLAQVALRGNPALLAKVDALVAKAQPAVHAVTQNVADASAAPTLGAVAAELLVEGAAYIKVVPNTAKP